MHWMLMPLKRYAQFSGRSRRMEFWMFILFQMLLWIAYGVLVFATVGTLMTGGGLSERALAAGSGIVVLVLLAGLLSFSLLIPSLAVSVRRLHDGNRSGWWLGGYFLYYGVVAVVSGISASAAASTGEPAMAGVLLQGLLSLGLVVYAIVLLVFYCLDGTPGPNRFGHDPKGRGYDSADVFA